MKQTRVSPSGISGVTSTGAEGAKSEGLGRAHLTASISHARPYVRTPFHEPYAPRCARRCARCDTRDRRCQTAAIGSSTSCRSSREVVEAAFGSRHTSAPQNAGMGRGAA